MLVLLVARVVIVQPQEVNVWKWPEQMQASLEEIGYALHAPQTAGLMNDNT